MECGHLPEDSFTEDQLKLAIIRCLAYFDVFSYPLTAEEIFRYMQTDVHSADSLTSYLTDLEHRGLTQQNSGYYVLADRDSEKMVNRRIKGEKAARKYLPLAKFIARFIGLFPFVSSVFISGTLAKNYMDRNTDIDFFIITQPGHLWTARLLLTIFKKTVLLNSYKFFCINYFVDTRHLTIPDQNLFTATELVSLIPVYNQNICNEFFKANQWVHNVLPNHPFSVEHNLDNSFNSSGSNKVFANFETVMSGNNEKGEPKSRIEFVSKELSTDNLHAESKKVHDRFRRPVSLLGSKLEKFSYRMFQRNIASKYGHLDAEKRNLTFRSTPHVSKHHPNDYQNFVLQKMEANMKEFSKKFNLNISQHGKCGS
jgi:hypothetical protein